MAFNISQGFKLQSPQFNFERDYFKSVAELKAAPESGFPDNFITNVAGVLYQLKKSNSVDATTGRWRKLGLGNLGLDLSAYAKKSETVPSTVTVNGTAIGSKEKNIAVGTAHFYGVVTLQEAETFNPSGNYAPSGYEVVFVRQRSPISPTGYDLNCFAARTRKEETDEKGVVTTTYTYYTFWDTMYRYGSIMGEWGIAPEEGMLYYSQHEDKLYIWANDTFYSLSLTANGLTVARKLTVGATGKRFDGTADVSWTAKEMGVGTKIATAYAGGKRMLYLKTSDDSNLTSLELPAATASAGGVMSASDKSALDALSWYEGD